MKTSENNVLTRTQTTNAKGFVLIELLTAVATIAILIGLLLPAIQRKREGVLAEEMTEELHAVVGAAKYYRSMRSEFPQSLAHLVQFVAANPSAGISIDPRLASGRINGYVWEVVEADQDHCKIEAEPEFPGITGSQTVTAAIELENTLVTSFTTPGSDEAREEMFNQIRAKGAETVVKLLKLDSSATSEVRSFVYEQIEWVFIANVMDTDGDGRITIDEIRNYDDPNMDSALKGPLAEFMDYTDDSCMFERASEEARADIGVSAVEIELARGDQAPLISYDGLSILTLTEITDGTSNTLLFAELNEKLEAAEAAEAAGDQIAKTKAIKDYQKAVKAQIGQTLTRTSANTLITMSKTL